MGHTKIFLRQRQTEIQTGREKKVESETELCAELEVERDTQIDTERVQRDRYKKERKRQKDRDSF
jgi:hypothetical protein